MVIRILFIALLVVLAGCANRKEKAIQADAGTHSTVSVTAPDFKPKKGQRFAWYSPVIWSGDEMATANREFGKLMTAAAEQELLSRGYEVAADKGSADYIIGMAVIDGVSDRSEKLAEFFRLFPHISKSAYGFDSATVVVGVVDRKSLGLVGDQVPDRQDLLWRSGLKAFILGDKVETELRKERVRAFIKRLMASLP